VYIWDAEKLTAMQLASAGTLHQAWMQQEHGELMLSVSIERNKGAEENST